MMNTETSPRLPNVPPVTRKPVYDLSRRVVELARAVDDLPSGRYVIEIVKDDLTAAAWRVEIAKVDTVQKMSLSKYNPE
jgi:hypothetical protein